VAGDDSRKTKERIGEVRRRKGGEQDKRREAPFLKASVTGRGEFSKKVRKKLGVFRSEKRWPTKKNQGWRPTLVKPDVDIEPRKVSARGR